MINHTKALGNIVEVLNLSQNSVLDAIRFYAGKHVSVNDNFESLIKQTLVDIAIDEFYKNLHIPQIACRNVTPECAESGDGLTSLMNIIKGLLQKHEMFTDASTLVILIPELIAHYREMFRLSPRYFNYPLLFFISIENREHVVEIKREKSENVYVFNIGMTWFEDVKAGYPVNSHVYFLT